MAQEGMLQPFKGLENPTVKNRSKTVFADLNGTLSAHLNLDVVDSIAGVTHLVVVMVNGVDLELITPATADA